MKHLTLISTPAGNSKGARAVEWLFARGEPMATRTAGKPVTDTG
jgi:hypothetical protein